MPGNGISAPSTSSLHPMPRLPPQLLHIARSIHPYLPFLLRTCRDIPSARLELKWLTEHLDSITRSTHRNLRHIYRFKSSPLHGAASFPSHRSRWIAKIRTLGGSKRRREELYRLCLERSRGKPLQYIIGDQPFGDLEILCRKGVLIPR